MGLFSFMSSKPATRITNNLYLGDKNHIPEDADFVIVCSVELMNAFIKNHKKHKYEMDEIVVDRDRPRIFLWFTDWAKFNNINLNTSIKALHIIDEHIKQNHKVYVHCMYGVNRSASHCFMYMVGTGRINEPTFKKAMHKFKKIYPGINPLFGWKKMLKYYYPYHDFFDQPQKVLDQKAAVGKYRKEKWLKRVKTKLERKRRKNTW